MRPLLAFLLMCWLMLAGIAAGLNDATVIPMREIVAKIESGAPINYSHVIIKGNLNISEAEIPDKKYVSSQIKIMDSTIMGYINLDNAIIQQPAIFKRTEFIKPVNFIGTQFKGGVVFDNSKFDDQSFFIGSEFNDLALFRFTKFNGFSSFFGAKFSGVHDFHNCRFNDTALFRSVIFLNDANFEEANFLGSANFRETQFKSAKFSGARFQELADFNLAQFNGTTDFTGIEFAKELYLNDAKFTRLLISWDSIEDRLACSGPAYLLLIRNFKELEQYEDADNCYYQYRQEKRRDRAFGWAKFFDYVSWLSCGYGVRWTHPILAGMGIVILFSIYFESCNLRWRKTAISHSPESKNAVKYFINNFKKSLGFSLMMLLSLPPEWSRFGKDVYIEFVAHHWFSSILERLIGWGLMLLLIGTLTRLMVRY